MLGEQGDGVPLRGTKGRVGGEYGQIHCIFLKKLNMNDFLKCFLGQV